MHEREVQRPGALALAQIARALRGGGDGLAQQWAKAIAGAENIQRRFGGAAW